MPSESEAGGLDVLSGSQSSYNPQSGYQDSHECQVFPNPASASTNPPHSVSIPSAYQKKGLKGKLARSKPWILFSRGISSLLKQTSRRVVDFNNNADNETQCWFSRATTLGHGLYYMGFMASTVSTPYFSHDSDPIRSTLNLLTASGASNSLEGLGVQKALSNSPGYNILEKGSAFLFQEKFEVLILCFLVAQVVVIGFDIPLASSNSDSNSTISFRWTTYALLVIFIGYTLELIMKLYIFGFTKKHFFSQSNFYLRRFVANMFFNKQLPIGPNDNTTTIQTQRPFAYNLFNCLDLLSICAFWFSFVMGFFGWEGNRYFQSLRMLSSLRILRLLRITPGTHIETIIIIRGLKGAGSTLSKVLSFTCFFSLLFAVVGAQNFKSSLRRRCHWSLHGSTPDSFQFCGRFLDNQTGERRPWLKLDGSYGATTSTGYLCPSPMVCVETVNPYGGSVSFDNIFQSLELVFVIMSANNFSDLMYSLMDSEMLAAALFFAAIIVVLYYWLVILFVGVCTGSLYEMRALRRGQYRTEYHKARMGNRKNTPQMWFDKSRWIWIAIIMYDTCVQTLKSYHMSNERSHFINSSERAVTILLAGEILVRFLVDMKRFHCSKRNLFDLGIAVITSIAQIPAVKRYADGQLYCWMTIFQIMRCYRIFWAITPARDLLVSQMGDTISYCSKF